MSSDYRERSSILGTRLFFVFLCTVLLPAVALTVLFNQRGDIDGRFVQAYYPLYGLVSCLLTLGIGAVTLWSTRQFAVPCAPTTSQGSPPGCSGFMAEFLHTLKLRNFRQLLAFDVAASVSYGVLIATHMLAYIYFWEMSAREIALLLALPSLLGVCAAMLAIHWLGSRLAKHTILRLTCAAMIIDGIWPYLLRLTGNLPENGHPLVFQALFLQMLLWMFFFILRGIASQSLIADIADEQDLASGRRQEGALFAASHFAQKLATAVGPLYGGAVLDVIGLRQGMAPGTIATSVLTGFAIFSLFGVMLPLLAALYFSFNVSLSEKRLREIQAQLAKR